MSPLLVLSALQRLAERQDLAPETREALSARLGGILWLGANGFCALQLRALEQAEQVLACWTTESPFSAAHLTDNRTSLGPVDLTASTG